MFSEEKNSWLDYRDDRPEVRIAVFVPAGAKRFVCLRVMCENWLILSLDWTWQIFEKTAESCKGEKQETICQLCSTRGVQSMLGDVRRNPTLSLFLLLRWSYRPSKFPDQFHTRIWNVAFLSSAVAIIIISGRSYFVWVFFLFLFFDWGGEGVSTYYPKKDKPSSVLISNTTTNVLDDALRKNNLLTAFSVKNMALRL